jgi:hypothetical protein
MKILKRLDYELVIEHCYQCDYCKGVRVFHCQRVKGKPEVSPYPQDGIPDFCPLSDKKPKGY